MGQQWKKEVWPSKWPVIKHQNWSQTITLIIRVIFVSVINISQVLWQNFHIHFPIWGSLKPYFFFYFTYEETNFKIVQGDFMDSNSVSYGMWYCFLLSHVYVEGFHKCSMQSDKILALENYHLGVHLCELMQPMIIILTHLPPSIWYVFLAGIRWFNRQ